jgi:hypothetical protein
MPDSSPITEDFPHVPINPYGESKLIVEKMLRWFDSIHNLRSICLRYFNAAAFASPAAGTFGNLGRNQFYGPSFRTVDMSVFKTTKLSGGASLQVRCEIFNVLNTDNWANPGTSVASSTTFGLLTNTRNGSGAPGIGAGEPRNVQLAAKILF